MRLFLFTLALCAIFITPTKADLVCPTGSLNGLYAAPVWSTYTVRSADYIDQWLRRLARNLKAVLDARSDVDQINAAKVLGEDNVRVMTRMFEEGFIAATDIINAYCVAAPDQQPWSDTIKSQREEAWCKEWGTAHFC